MRNLKVAFYPTPTPDSSQWNIGGVGPSAVGAGVGHVHFIFLCRFHLRLVVNANPVSSGIWPNGIFHSILHDSLAARTLSVSICQRLYGA